MTLLPLIEVSGLTECRYLLLAGTRIGDPHYTK